MTASDGEDDNTTPENMFSDTSSTGPDQRVTGKHLTFNNLPLECSKVVNTQQIMTTEHTSLTQHVAEHLIEV